MNLFGCHQRQSAHMLHSTLKLLGSTLVMVICWVLAFSYDGKCGAYIDTHCFDDGTESLLQQLFDKKK